MASHPLLEWFATAGVRLHPSLYLEQDARTGLSFYSLQPLPKHTSVVRVPASLCITPQTAFKAIVGLLDSQKRSLGPNLAAAAADELAFQSLPAPDWILLYLVLCRIAGEYLEKHSSDQDISGQVRHQLRHIPYVQHIPSVIPTPLHFSSAELDLLQNTPLHGSTLRRLQETIVDYIRATSVLLPHLSFQSHFSQELSRVLTPLDPAITEDELWQHTYHAGLELWRWAESAFTSRAFPSRLIGLTFPTTNDSPSTMAPSPFSQASSKDGSVPILIPAYDTFNHCRAMPVTWNHVPPPSQSRSADTPHPSIVEGSGHVEMILDYEVQPHQQVWNNYGGKSNEEFLAGYGFTLDTNSEDTLALKLGSDATPPHYQAEGKSQEHGSGDGEAKTHYWPMNFPAPTQSIFDDSDLARSSRFIKSASPCPSLFREIEQRLSIHSEDGPSDSRLVEAEGGEVEEDLTRYAQLLETLEQLLLSKRKVFKVSQAKVDSLIQGDSDSTNTKSTTSTASTASTTSIDIQNAVLIDADECCQNARQKLDKNRPWIRKSVYSNVQTYRKSQLKILNNAISWTRAELERLAEAFDHLELDGEEGEEEEEAEGIRD